VAVTTSRSGLKIDVFTDELERRSKQVADHLKLSEFLSERTRMRI
jgi:hypothetical protein